VVNSQCTSPNGFVVNRNAHHMVNRNATSPDGFVVDRNAHHVVNSQCHLA
jgi:hypothetical protein